MHKSLIPILLLTIPISTSAQQPIGEQHRTDTREAQPGSLPEKWNNGTDENEPPIQVHAYNKDFYILRQSKRVHFEAPFMYLIIGRDKAILIDTGAPGGLESLPDTVNKIIGNRKGSNGKPLQLIVAHTHGHFDHTFNDFLFRDKPGVTVIGTRFRKLQEFFGFKNWPNEIATLDLGDRVLDLIPTPGHHPCHICIYDRSTRILITGDTFYPGFLFTFRPEDWPKFRASISRLVKFVDEHPVSHILGCHIEMANQKRVPYRYGTVKQPNERRLELTPKHLRELHTALEQMGDKPKVELHDDFIIFPAWTTSIFGALPDEKETKEKKTESEEVADSGIQDKR